MCLSVFTVELPKRKSIRLPGYDYSQAGWYFVTICVQNRSQILENIENGKMVLNQAGNLIDKWWKEIPEKFENVGLDVYQTMPNHIHGILIVHESFGRTHRSAPTGGVNAMNIKSVGVDPCVDPISNPCVNPISNPCVDPIKYSSKSKLILGNIIQWFKTMATNEYIKGVRNHEFNFFEKRLFQRNFYEHIIRNENELNKIRQYIIQNPLLWNRDRNNPNSI